MLVEDIDESVSITAYGCLESSVHRRQGTRDQIAIGIEQFNGNKTAYEYKDWRMIALESPKKRKW